MEECICQTRRWFLIKLQGNLLQVGHMLYELISVDDRIVSVEKLDDVAVEIDGKVIAEQIKSVTSSNNPMDERSVVFFGRHFTIGVLTLNTVLCQPALFGDLLLLRMEPLPLVAFRRYLQMLIPMMRLEKLLMMQKLLF